MSRFLLVPNTDREIAVAIAGVIAEYLTQKNHEVVVMDADAGKSGLFHFAIDALDNNLPDVAISIGGDGTMLHTLDLMCPRNIPVFGINVGTLGYLTEVDPSNWQIALDRYINGKFQTLERMTLATEVKVQMKKDTTHSTLSLSRKYAINELVVEKSSGNTAYLQVAINGVDLMKYVVDGMIIATPTGSTAYNLSARGPIVSPEVEAILITPVSPHMLFDRTLVFGSNDSIQLTILGPSDAEVVIDGRHVATVAPGGIVECSKSQYPARIITFEAIDFFKVLQTKFRLADR